MKTESLHHKTQKWDAMNRSLHPILSSSLSPTPDSDPAVTFHPKYGKLPVYQPGSFKLDPQDDDEYFAGRKYRKIYYILWGEFTAGLLNEEQWSEYDEWFEEEISGGEREEMLLVSFIKHFNITREQFDSAVEEFTKRNTEAGWDMTREENEVPNGDIIYTFDNKIINEYYRYE
ncbi:MAG TPA: hypothetical protein PK830_03670 [Candidatus Atribacteria bacterium]|nr:hypothetical protein [Candidatus Atribacteria bacterium]